MASHLLHQLRPDLGSGRKLCREPDREPSLRILFIGAPALPSLSLEKEARAGSFQGYQASPMLLQMTLFNPHTLLSGMRLPTLEIGQGQLREDEGVAEITQLRAGTGWDFTSLPAHYQGAWRS